MNGRKDSAISFGIMSTPVNQIGNANRIHAKKRSAVRRKNTVPGKIGQMSQDEFDGPHTKLPPPGKPPFTPKMFITEPVPLPHFPPPRKLKLFSEEETIHNEPDCFHSRTEWPPSSKQSYSMTGSIPWDFFKVIFAGVFIFLKYAFMAVAVIITIGCMICAGRQTRD